MKPLILVYCPESDSWKRNWLQFLPEYWPLETLERLLDALRVSAGSVFRSGIVLLLPHDLADLRQLAQNAKSFESWRVVLELPGHGEEVRKAAEPLAPRFMAVSGQGEGLMLEVLKKMARAQ